MVVRYSLLTIGPAPAELVHSPWGPFAVTACADLDAAAAALAEQHFDAIWLAIPGEAEVPRLLAWPALSQAMLDAAVIVSWPQPSPLLALQLVARGVHDVLPHDEATSGPVGRALRLGIERKLLENAARKAHATDLATGLPNHAQLLEHMTHLLALREREPAPMAVLALRVDGLATVAAQLGVEAANVLRRKAAVRLRAGLRASDVVAAIGTDTFAVLLAWVDESGAGQRVAAKLVQALQQPFTVAGTPAVLAVSVGVSDYPQHGRDADALLRRAVAQSAELASVGRAGFAAHVERGSVDAANDALPPSSA